MIILIIITLCCTTSLGLGESFSLRSNVCFGDTQEQIIEKETQQGVTIAKHQNNTLNATVVLAGVPNTKLSYSFDSNNKLIKMSYFLETDESFEQINNALIKKYGSTTYNHVTGKKLNGFTDPIAALHANADPWDPSNPRYYDWIIEDTDGSLIHIRHSAILGLTIDFTTFNYFAIRKFHAIEYTHYSQESKEWNAYMNYQNSVANDL